MTCTSWKLYRGRGVKVLIDWKGYHLHGEVLEAQRALLGSGTLTLRMYLVHDPMTGETVGIDPSRCVVMAEPPVINLKGRLKGRTEL